MINLEDNKQPKRRYSLEDDFMNYDSDDLLYGYMRSISTAAPNGGKYKEYLSKKNYAREKSSIAKTLNCSTRTVDRHLDKLIQVGLVTESKIDELEIYTFPYDYDGKYELTEPQVIKYVVDAHSAQGVRIYIYLLNKYKWKKDYVFTISELKKALGYAATTKTAESTIKNCLASLKDKLIKYEHFTELEDVGGINGVHMVPVERMKLQFVVSETKDLPKY